MFLSHRATQAEYFDVVDRPPAEITEAYSSLAWFNRLFHFADPFQRLLPNFIGRDRCPSLTFLDLGAGDGSLGILLAKWAREQHGWDWRFTNLDFNPTALRLDRDGRNIAASVLDLPFRDASFDVVIASQMTHHLTKSEDVVRHLREAWRVAKGAIYFSDLHRGLLLYGMLWLAFRLRRHPEHFRHDSMLSVERGFRVPELQGLADQAGLTKARAWLYYGARVILQARKF